MNSRAPVGRIGNYCTVYQCTYSLFVSLYVQQENVVRQKKITTFRESLQGPIANPLVLLLIESKANNGPLPLPPTPAYRGY